MEGFTVVSIWDLIRFCCLLAGCSTVLLPDRVVQALNLNLEAGGDARFHNRYNGSVAPDYGKY